MSNPLPNPTELSDQPLLRIDLGAMTRNYKVLSQLAKGAETACVVKSNAYGLGIAPVTNALLGAGCKTFFVAQAQEGETLRPLAPDAEIYVLNGLAPTSASLLTNYNLIPCLGTLEEIVEWQSVAADKPAALHIDTGFNRLGLPLSDISKVKNFSPHILMSHLACGHDPAHEMNASQVEAFKTCRSAFPNSKASLANSAGVLMGEAYHFNMTRVGTAMYGGAALLDHSSALETVVYLHAPVLQTKHVAKGQTVGYGASYLAQQDMKIAILALGYGDGFTRHLSGEGSAKAFTAYQGQECPIVGRVSMDLLALDITGLENQPQRGDFVELIGDTVKIEPLAKRAGTISYELLTQLGTRYKRQYKK